MCAEFINPADNKLYIRSTATTMPRATRGKPNFQTKNLNTSNQDCPSCVRVLSHGVVQLTLDPSYSAVLSFMSQWGPPQTRSDPPSPAAVTDEKSKAANVAETVVQTPNGASSSTPTAVSPPDSPTGRTPRNMSSSRPQSMIQTMQPPLMEVSEGTLPELQRIFSFLNAHSTKLYQEGYFLKLHDLDTRT